CVRGRWFWRGWFGGWCWLGLRLPGETFLAAAPNTAAIQIRVKLQQFSTGDPVSKGATVHRVASLNIMDDRTIRPRILRDDKSHFRTRCWRGGHSSCAGLAASTAAATFERGLIPVSPVE